MATISVNTIITIIIIYKCITGVLQH